MRIFAVLLIGLCLAGMSVAGKKPKEEILLNFAGSLKRIDKKEIVINSDGDNEMTFYRSRRTAFFSGDKPVDSDRLTPGSMVTIQASEKLNGDLEAVTVTVTLADQPASK